MKLVSGWVIVLLASVTTDGLCIVILTGESRILSMGHARKQIIFNAATSRERSDGLSTVVPGWFAVGRGPHRFHDAKRVPDFVRG